MDQKNNLEQLKEAAQKWKLSMESHIRRTVHQHIAKATEANKAFSHFRF
jgi:hypothetical protein